jgi:hypothetical protein
MAKTCLKDIFEKKVSKAPAQKKAMGGIIKVLHRMSEADRSSLLAQMENDKPGSAKRKK